MVTIDSTTWAALALVLTIIGAALSWVAWRRRGPAAGIRGAGVDAGPGRRLADRHAEARGEHRRRRDQLGDPAGLLTSGVGRDRAWPESSAGLFVLSGMLRARGIGVRGKAAERRAAQQSPKQLRKPKQDRDDLDDMADIEAILKKHGI